MSQTLDVTGITAMFKPVRDFFNKRHVVQIKIIHCSLSTVSSLQSAEIKQMYLEITDLLFSTFKYATDYEAFGLPTSIAS